MSWNPFRRENPAQPELNPAIALGRQGEELARLFLRREGYKILHRNFRGHQGGEIDIVCREISSNTLVFVEVKTRSSADFGSPSAAVNTAKQRLITRGALAWLRMLDNPDVVFRFDIVEVVMNEGNPAVTVLRDAFQLPEPFIY